MTDFPDISVVIPTYNRAHTIKRCLDSVLNQSSPPREVVVVDDGSSDDTRTVVNAFNDERITYIHQDNAGANRARNRGVEEAACSWIAFQDADDIWLPHKLETLIKAHGAAQKEGCDSAVVFSSFLTYDGATGSVSMKPSHAVGTPLMKILKDPIGESRLLVENMISTQTLLVKRDVLMEVGKFDESLRRFQDWDLAIRLAGKSPFVFVPEPLVVAEALSGSISSNYNHGVKTRAIFLEKYKALFAEYPSQKKAAKQALRVRQLARFFKR